MQRKAMPQQKLARLLPPQQALDAQQKLARLEGLSEIVIAPRFESRDAVRRIGQRREHQHRHAVAIGAE